MSVLVRAKHEAVNLVLESAGEIQGQYHNKCKLLSVSRLKYSEAGCPLFALEILWKLFVCRDDSLHWELRS